MDYTDRISYSQVQMLQSLEGALDRLNTFRYDGNFRRILGENFAGRLNEWLGYIRRQKENPFTVVVIGDFKRGKSTLINALLGEEVATTDVTTETVTLNRISYGPHSSEAVLSGNRTLRLSDAELKREAIEKIVRETGEPIRKIEIVRPIDLLKKITILDTPGTGDAMQDFSDMVKESLLQADAVIYVYNAQYPLSKSEQLFLKSTVLPQKYTSLFLVGNFADILGNQRNYDRMRELLSEKVNDLLPGAEVLMVSAYDELCRIRGEERPCDRLSATLEEQFGRLRSLLGAAIEEKADTVVLDRMQRLSAAMTADLLKEIGAMEAGLEMDAGGVAAALERLEKDKQRCAQLQEKETAALDESIAAMKAEATRWMLEFLGRIEAETQNLAGYSYETLVKHYEFYCIDKMQEAMNTCIDFHQELLFDRMEEISAELSGEFAGQLEEKREYSFRVDLDNRVWTKGDTAGFAISYATGVFPVLSAISSLVVDGIVGAVRENAVNKSAPDLIAQIARKLPQLHNAVVSAVDKAYTEMGDKAKKLVESHFAQQVASAQHLVETSSEVARKQTAEKEEIRQVLMQAREMLKGVTDAQNG